MFDWGALLELRRFRSGSELDYEDDGWNDRIVDWYIRDSIDVFESQEAESLREVPILPRRSSQVADIVLGSLPAQEVILLYETVVPGACDRIMRRASEKLDHDGRAELQLLRDRARQGYVGMAVGFLLTMLLALGAFFLILSDYYWAGSMVAAIILALVVSTSVYVSRAQLRRKFYTRDFFIRRSRHSLIS